MRFDSPRDGRSWDGRSRSGVGEASWTQEEPDVEMTYDDVGVEALRFVLQ